MKVIPIFKIIRQDLERVERKMREVYRIEYEQMRTILDYLLSGGGKRMRPALVLLSSKFYPADAEKVTSLAAAVETLHTATLVHDDLIDNAFLRRGNPTLNTMWNSAATVLTGDYLFARSAAFAAETESVRVVSIFAQTLMTICSGELNQIFDSKEGERTTATAREYYYQRIYSKTASLFAASTEAGGVLSGAPEPEIQALRDYGYNLGMAFQIVDDILDFAGNEDVLGKPVGSDLRQGILTLPTLYFLEAHPEDETVTSVLNGRDRGGDEAQALKAIKESGAIESSTAEAKRFAAKSREALTLLPPNEYRQAMLDLANFVVERRE